MKTAAIFRLAILLLFLGTSLKSEIIVAPLPVLTDDVAHNITVERAFLQPILWVGPRRPSDAESQELWQALIVMREQGVKGGFPLLEGFIADHPNSAWTPALRANLAHHYRRHGRITLALEHWEIAWRTLRGESEGRGKWVADFTLAHWTRLLASLGRFDDLRVIFAETKHRVLDQGHLQQIFNGTKEGFAIMNVDPGVSYRCGTFALANAARILGVDRSVGSKLMDIPSPAIGFSLAKLKSLSDDFRLGLVPVERPVNDQTIVVPSVVHWKQNHYGAILQQRDGAYLIVDPTFEDSVWVSAETINAEASGRFMVSPNAQRAGWSQLSDLEAAITVGKGFPTHFDDNLDEDCQSDDDANNEENDPESPLSNYDPNLQLFSEGACGPAEDDPCETDRGMPVWRVSEPFVNLWISDKPLFYSTSYGKLSALKLNFKQRDTRPALIGTNENFSLAGFGPSWEFNSLSYVQYHGSVPENNIAYLYKAGGGRRQYVGNGSAPHRRSRSYMCGRGAGSCSPEGCTAGAVGNCTQIPPRIYAPTMATNDFEYVVGFSTQVTNFFLTKKTDRWGRSRNITYATVQPQGGGTILRIDRITDPDLKEMVFTYDASFPGRTITVTCPAGSASFTYHSSGHLKTITDMGGLTSTFTYDANGWITNMVTPYGTNQFRLVGAGPGEIPNYSANVVQRAVEVTEPDGKKQLFIYRSNSQYLSDANQTELISAAAPAATVPAVPYPQSLVTLDNANHMEKINSFHWGRAQYSRMSQSYLTSGGSFAALTLEDYRRARRRKWLKNGTMESPDIGGVQPGIGLRLQGEPSQDVNGGTWGQTTWYGYELPDDGGNIDPPGFGFPAYIGRRLPDGQSQWLLLKRTGDWWQLGELEWGFTDLQSVHRTHRKVQLEYAALPARDLLSVKDVTAGPIDLLAYTYVPNTHLIQTLTLPTGEKQVCTYSGSKLDQIVHQNASNAPFLTNTFTRYPSGTHLGWVEKRVDFGVATNTYTYDKGNVISQTDPLFLTRSYTRDGLQRITTITYPSPGGFEQFTYSKLDLTSVLDRLGKTTSYGYDSVRQLTHITNRTGMITKLDYCDCGSPSTITAGFGTSLAQATVFSYDNQGNLLSVQRPDSTTQTYERDELGRVKRLIRNPGDFRVHYHPQGTLADITGLIGGQEKFIFKALYDHWDRPTNVVDGTGAIVTNLWDKAGRILVRGIESLASGYELFLHSERGLVGYTNQLGKIFRFELDPLGRRITETNDVIADQQIIRYAYDAPGNVRALTDGRGKNTTWTYDAEGRLTQKRDHNNNLVYTYTYDANGRVVSRTDAGSPPRTTQFAYDFEGRLRMVDYPAGASAPDLHYLYDLLGRLTNSVSSNQFTCSYSYTAGNQLASEAGPWADSTVSYGYTDRLRTSLTVLQPNASSWVQSLAYDSARRLQTAASPAGTFTYTYRDVVAGLNVIGALVDNLALPSGMNVDSVLDNFGRLTETSLLNGATVLNRHGYLYNQGHQRTQQTRTIGASGNYLNYTYDARGQLKTALGYENGGTPARDHEQLTYTYDLGDNLTQRQSKNLIQPFTPNDLNQVSAGAPSGSLTVSGTSSATANNVTVTVNGNAGAATRYNDATFARADVPLLTGAPSTISATATDTLGRSDTEQFTLTIAGAATYTYDANGNLTGDIRRAFTYNEENQLTSVSVANLWKTEFQYDAFLRRRVRKEFTWNGSGWTPGDEVRYVYDGMNVVQERDGNNVPRVTYTRGSDLSGSREGAGGIGGLLARTDSTLMNLGIAGAHAYYHADGNGNVTALVNTNKAAVARYVYDPFGNLLGKSGPLATANTYRFSSKEFHDSSGLYYYGYRFYEPNLQRWLNRDPSGEASSLNLYSFVSNNPQEFIDPFGEDAITVGPITFPIPFTTEWWEQEAQAAHERQHRDDWLKRFPGWRKEQRGFKAEIPVWKDRIKRTERHIEFLRQNLCKLRLAERALPYYEDLLQDMRNALDTAEHIAENDKSAMEYWNDAARRWYQSPVAPLPPLPPGFAPPPPNVRRNRPILNR